MIGVVMSMPSRYVTIDSEQNEECIDFTIFFLWQKISQ